MAMLRQICHESLQPYLGGNQLKNHHVDTNSLVINIETDD